MAKDRYIMDLPTIRDMGPRGGSMLLLLEILVIIERELPIDGEMEGVVDTILHEVEAYLVGRHSNWSESTLLTVSKLLGIRDRMLLVAEEPRKQSFLHLYDKDDVVGIFARRIIDRERSKG